jgi:hypothetical protein
MTTTDQERQKVASPADDDVEENSSSPSVHSSRIRGQLDALIDHLNADRKRVDDPRFQTLLEVSAEMLKGVRNSFVNFDEARRRTMHLSQ